ncbi:MAG: hypothetical protein ACOC32_02685 [Nanoarchaeota archaeon]
MRRRGELLAGIFLLLLSMSVYASPFTDFLERGIVGIFDLLGSVYVIMVIVIAVVYGLFYNIIRTALSNVPLAQNAEERSMKAIAHMIALLTTFGLLFGSAYGNGGFSIYNVESNINNLVGAFGKIGPWILALLLGSLVYFTLTKNHPDMSRWRKLGLTLMTIGFVLWATNKISGQNGIYTGVGFAIIGGLLALFSGAFGSGSGNGTGSSNGGGGLGGVISSWLSTRPEMKRLKMAKKAEEDEKERSRQALRRGDTLKRFGHEIEKDKSRIEKALLEVADYLRKERDDLQAEYKSKERLENLFSGELARAKNAVQQNKQNPIELKKALSEMIGAIDIVKREEKEDVRTDKKDKKFDRRISRDLFRKAKKGIEHELRRVEHQLSDLRDFAQDTDSHEVSELSERYRQMKDFLTRELKLFDQHNDEGLSFFNFIVDIERIHKDIRSKDQEMQKVSSEAEAKLDNLVKELAVVLGMHETEDNKKEKSLQAFYNRLNKERGHIDHSIDTIANDNKIILNELNRLMNDLKYLGGLLSELIKNNQLVEQEYETISSLLVEVEKQTDGSVDDYNANVKKFNTISDSYQTALSYYSYMTDTFFADVEAFDNAYSNLALDDVMSKAQSLKQELVQENHMEKEVKAIDDSIKVIDHVKHQADAMKQLHDQFKDEMVEDEHFLERDKVVTMLKRYEALAKQEDTVAEHKQRFNELQKKTLDLVERMADIASRYNVEMGNTTMTDELKKYAQEIPHPLEAASAVASA